MKKMLFLAALLCVSSGAGAVDYLISSGKDEPPVIIIHEPYGRGRYMPYPPPRRYRPAPPPRAYYWRR